MPSRILLLHRQQALMTHCYHKLLHEQWWILLDDEFLEAWQHSIIIMCFNGILQQFYPRIFTCSADYCEKYVRYDRDNVEVAYLLICRILLASIKNLGRCPCPRCLIPLDQIHNLAKPRDMARRVTAPRVDSVMRRTRVSATRRLIYEKNMQVNCTVVRDLLYETSLVPTSVSMRCILIYRRLILASERLFRQALSVWVRHTQCTRS